jgi:hypothetical protein
LSAQRRFADANDDFDPKSIDRESDEVDVCIVGGGKMAIGRVHDKGVFFDTKQVPLD